MPRRPLLPLVVSLAALAGCDGSAPVAGPAPAPGQPPVASIAAPTQPAGFPAELVGTWTAGDVSPAGFADAAGKVAADLSKPGTVVEFAADGKFRWCAVSAGSVAGTPLEAATYLEGTATADRAAGTLTLTPTGGREVSRTAEVAPVPVVPGVPTLPAVPSLGGPAPAGIPQGNYDRPADPARFTKTVKWSVSADVLTLTDPAGTATELRKR